MDDKIKKLIDSQFKLKSDLLEIQHELAHRIKHYEGTLQDALSTGLVKLNFPAPPGFYKRLESKGPVKVIDNKLKS